MKRLAIALVLLTAVASAVVLLAGPGAASHSFNPSVDVQLSDDEHLVNASITTTFDIPGTDYNYKVLVSFTPPEFGPEAPDVPIGARVGEIDSWTTLGLLNGACNTPLAPHFDLLWASTDTSDTCTFDEQFAEDFLWNPYAWQPGIECYPDFITRILPGPTPVQRMFGAAVVTGQKVSINFVVLEAGALGYPAAWGRPSVAILNNRGDPAAERTPGVITDFCTPLDTDIVVFGLSRDNPTTGDDEAGYEVRQNPAYGGTYTFRWYTESMPDADGDGIANYNDTCPYDVNVDPSFKEVGGHPDNDGIDSACDPDPAANCYPGAEGMPDFTDCDGDGFKNRGDNCPLMANPDQTDTDTDDIGDACDPSPTTPDGVPIELTVEVDVEIGEPDSDGDGVPDAEDNCPTVHNPNQTDTDEDGLGDVCDPAPSDADADDDTVLDGDDNCVLVANADQRDGDVDGLGDACDNCPAVANSDQTDTDTDGIGDACDNCPLVTNADQADMDGDGIGDVCDDDIDGDGVRNDDEGLYGSDPEDADSTPEALRWDEASGDDSCTDGMDNDGDSLTDSNDPGCWHFQPHADVDLSSYYSDVNADLTMTFDIPGTDYNYKVLVSFTPVEFFPAESSDVPLGAKVGEMDSLATLGLLNGACNVRLAPHFDLYWASTDTSSTVTFRNQFRDSDGNGLHDGIDQYPDFLARILPGITPLQRMYGDTNVSGTLMSINFVVLEAGALPGYPAAWGQPSVSVLNDIGDPAAVPTPGGAITDFCTPLGTTTVIFGLSEDNPATGDNEAGYEVRRNPAYGGTYTFRWYAESMRDADGDGYENYGDTCPFDDNLENFKEPTGHPDQDGIDSACDPDRTLPCWEGVSFIWSRDCDWDNFYNRGDNCPLVANPDQADRDADDIGDACDPNPDTPDGDPILWIQEADVEISAWTDLKVADQYVESPPAEIALSEDVHIVLDKVLHNNGPYSPVDAVTETVITVPAGCTVSPSTHVQLFYNVPISVDILHHEPFTIHCYELGERTFVFDNAVEVSTPGIVDPDPSNDGALTELTVAAVTQADVKITGVGFVDPPTKIPMGQNVDITLRKHVHNNGPWDPVDIAIDATAAAPTGCTIVPKDVPSLLSAVPVSVDQVVDEVWTINCTDDWPPLKTFRFDNSIGVATPYVSDPDQANNSSRKWLSVRDPFYPYWGDDICDGQDNDGDTVIDEGWDLSGSAIADCLDPELDTDGDTLINEVDEDDDGDGWSDADEGFMRTDPLNACPLDAYHDAWSPDVNNDGSVDIIDVLRYKPVVRGLYDRRYDQNADGSGDILDVLLYKPVLGMSCTTP